MKEKGASPVFFQYFYRFRLMFRSFIYFELILLYSIRKGFSFSHLLVNIWFYNTLYWKGYSFLFCTLAPLWMLSFHMCMHYCLCSLFCSVGCLPANQFLFFDYYGSEEYFAITEYDFSRFFFFFFKAWAILAFFGLHTLGNYILEK